MLIPEFNSCTLFVYEKALYKIHIEMFRGKGEFVTYLKDNLGYKERNWECK